VNEPVDVGAWLARLETADTVLAARGVSFNVDNRTGLSLRLLVAEAVMRNTAAIERLLDHLGAPTPAAGLDRLLATVERPVSPASTGQEEWHVASAES